MADVAKLADAYNWNLTRLAEGLGFHRDTIRTRLNSAGVKPVDRKGNAPLFRLQEVAEVMFASSVVNGAGDWDPEKLPPKERLDYYKGSREKTALEVTNRQLIPDHEYRDDLAKTLKAVAGFFDSLPDKMERTRLFTPEQLEQIEKVSDEFRLQLHANLAEVEG